MDGSENKMGWEGMGSVRTGIFDLSRNSFLFMQARVSQKNDVHIDIYILGGWHVE